MLHLKCRVTNFSALAVFENIYISGLENEFLRTKMIYIEGRKIMSPARYEHHECVSMFVSSIAVMLLVSKLV